MLPTLIGDVMDTLSDGHLYSAIFDSPHYVYSWIESIANTYRRPVTFLSRTPESRLGRNLDLDVIQSVWISNKSNKEGILLNHESIYKYIESRSTENSDVFVIEGLEWLISESGTRHTLRHIMNLSDYIFDKQIVVIYVLQANTIDEEVMEKISRQAPLLDVSSDAVPDQNGNTFTDTGESGSVPTQEEEYPLIPYLTTLPLEGFSHKILRKRILQWRRLGFDVSDCEPGIFCDDIGESHSIYLSVDKKVREATELLNIMDSMRDNISKSEFTVMEFRLRQLTGMNEVSSKLRAIIDDVSDS
ncbi:MAG: hypothetical protein CL997_05895 [Euryarchaeota archaeon]|nr:hypothetical protein [Euryarchaeota archaeon]